MKQNGLEPRLGYDKSPVRGLEDYSEWTFGF
jgi:hypothetical protein